MLYSNTIFSEYCTIVLQLFCKASQFHSSMRINAPEFLFLWCTLFLDGQCVSTSPNLGYSVHLDWKLFPPSPLLFPSPHLQLRELTVQHLHLTFHLINYSDWPYWPYVSDCGVLTDLIFVTFSPKETSLVFALYPSTSLSPSPSLLSLLFSQYPSADQVAPGDPAWW